MRLSTQQAGPIVIGDTVYGVNLGFDFCAEHEWGIGWAGRYLGRQGKPTRELHGAACRTTTKVAPDFSLELEEIGGALWMRGMAAWKLDYGSLAEVVKDKKKRSNAIDCMLSSWNKDKPVTGAWSGDDGFCVVGRTDEAKEAIRVAHKALVDGACYIIQSGGIFGAGGLKLIDARLIPDETRAELDADDLSALALEDAVVATGIRERLEAAGRRYFALSPRWVDERAGTFKFWLNPHEQRANNYGWFSLQDLEDWIAGKGPIPMRAAAEAAQ